MALFQRDNKTPNRNKPKMERKLHFSIWYVLFAVMTLFLFNDLFFSSHVKEVPYSTFKELLRQNRIFEAGVSTDRIEGHYFIGDSTALSARRARFDSLKATTAGRSGFNIREIFAAAKDRELFAEKNLQSFFTRRIEDAELVKELEAFKVAYRGVEGEEWLRSLILGWILPFAILFAIWGFIFKRMNPSGGMMSIGKSKAKIYVEGQTKVTFKDVAGIDEALGEVSEIVEFLRNPEKFQRLGGRIPKGVLLVGPPGTGKTLLAKAVAGEAQVPFFSISGSDFVEMFVGVGAARVRDLFQQASQKAPCIIFIDELDALGKARGVNVYGGHDEREQTLNQLLSEMDGFEANTGVIIMAATNRPEILDIALLRPGRFDRQIVVDRPDINGREAILTVHARQVKLAREVDLKVIAARTPGFVGADLANLLNEAALIAARHNKKKVEMQDLEEAIDRVVAGLEKKSRVMNKREKETVAYHEAGHAIVATAVPGSDPVHRVSIIPRGVAALGYTLQLPTEDRYLMTRSELIGRITVLLGGRVAEELQYGQVSTGGQNDLERATDIARSMVVEYGMSEKIGPVSYGRGGRTLFLGAEMPESRVYSESLAAKIDAEIKLLLEEAEKKVRTILHARQKQLETLAQRLLEKEMVEKEELLAILSGDGGEADGE
ncbi:MAG TPA: ATP-dependent zinc metalloprotease FtsH [bacterium]|nr:ATP-dependent zinc metalloprotease FtsH [bacterium]HOC88134.1 ATP-dependent zinc metalloprotease FtsH [bacterium]HOZ20334.1 ATP-dependent zinc metalloprotease FtsH [bacterium]